MIVADTSSLITLSLSNSLQDFLDEFEVHTTEEVISELLETSSFDDSPGKASESILEKKEKIEVHAVEDKRFESSRIDAGEASCVILANRIKADFLLTDDIRALPELKAVSNSKVAISPVALKALVKKDVITEEEAVERMEKAASERDWLESSIYRRALEILYD